MNLLSCVFIYCRAREAELEKQFQSDLSDSEADHLRKTQDMLTEFNFAQQLLKDKIVKLQNMYVFLLISVAKLLFVIVVMLLFLFNIVLTGYAEMRC